MLQKITDLTGPPEIGRYYLVPAIWSHVSKIWMPILGNHHNDKDHFEVSVDHYHNDLRFSSDRLIRSLWGAPEHHVIATEHNSINPFSHHVYEDKIELRRMKCKRDFPDFGFPGKTRLWNKFHDAFKGTCLKNGKICPHKGYDVSQVKPDKNGNIVCPLHGLSFNIKTGKNVPRPI